MIYKQWKGFPRLPLDGRLDLTYRCNNTCRHCWLWLSPKAFLSREELSFDEIKRIVDEARRMGCQAWSISGGEPMLRPDFADIFDYITRKAISFSLNTNGTLITPQIARLLTRKGSKMVALYGATAEVHDHVTRNPGSFEATMRGFACLQEAGADFTVQIVPMQANYHQYNEMVALAQTLSASYRVGASWLWLSASPSESRNNEITGQRLNPGQVIALDEPYDRDEILDTSGSNDAFHDNFPCVTSEEDDRLFIRCIAGRREFHIDPYGGMSFCSYIKDPALRYDLRQGNFRQAWDEFIPSLSNLVHGGREYLDNCGSCELRKDCRWCGVYAYLEHGRYSAKVDYLCQVADQAHRFKDDWKSNHLRYFQIAGITIRVATDFPITDKTFAPIYNIFKVSEMGNDTISIKLKSPVPSISKIQLEEEIYWKPPWAIYRWGTSWVYLEITSQNDITTPNVVAIFNESHNKGTVYRSADFYLNGGLHSLTTLVTDQILLARILSDRQACFLHASGIIMNDKGLLFVGHSEAGKSTTLKMLKEHGEILCDDRIILRRWTDGFRIHGTWSHGELPDVSSNSAPLQAIMYLEQASTNQLIPLTDKRERLSLVLSHMVRPLVTGDWWEKMLDLAGHIAAQVPAYRMRFDKSGRIVDQLKEI